MPVETQAKVLVLTLLGLLLLLCGQAAGGTRQGPPTCPERAPTWATDEPSNGDPTWSPNGEELAFASNRSGRLQIYVLRVADCIVRQVTSHPDGGWLPDWSPDGRRIAFVGDVSSSIWIVGADGRGLRRLTRGPRPDYEPAWSPNGRVIAFRRGFLRRAVHVMAPNGRGLRRLRAGFHPAWSPNGRRIAFIGPDDGTWVMRSDGSRPRRVKRGAANGDSDVDWAPDGRKLAVIDDQRAVTLFSLEDGQRTKLTIPPSNILGDDHPVFAPDGQKVAFTRSDGGSENIYVVSTFGGEVRQLTFGNTRIQSIRWTPDGKHLIFASNRSGSFQLWKIQESGSPPEPLPASGNGATDFAISRDGSQLLFAQTSIDTNIWRFEPANTLASYGSSRIGSSSRGGRWSQLIASSRTDDSPQYSPDGLRIAFASQRSGNEEIWVCDSDGSHARKLTTMRGPSTGSPRWSPDGRELAFDSRVAGQAEIFVISAEGGQPRRLTNNAALDVVPGWSRDGRWIYFSSMRSGSRQIWKAPASGGEAVQVTRNGGFDSFETVDGKYLYYTRQRETAGIWRLRLDEGAEEPVPGMDGIKGHRSWALTDHGIYFADSTTTGRLLRFYDFATDRIADVTGLAKDPLYGPPGLTVSPDGRSILYVQRDSSSSDIMLIENFR